MLRANPFRNGWIRKNAFLLGSPAVFLDIAQALKTLHSLEPPVIHRDIKPSNIIKSKAGMYVLVDFDASRLLTQGRIRIPALC